MKEAIKRITGAARGLAGRLPLNKLGRRQRLAALGLLLAALLGGVWLFWDGADDETIEKAVVVIQVTSQRGNWFAPWKQTNPAQATGSGFVIQGRRIITNAHVVSDARQIIVRRSDNTTPFFAQVAFVAHDSDLALLKVEDERFFDGITALKLGGLPSLLTRVRTYGYPAGGEQISRTEGVVSRIEFKPYMHTGADAHLTVQTDSAINPGNSGGPVVQDGRVVGVAFQTNTQLNDVGFFIPAPLVQRFLNDIQDGRYDGYGEAGIVTSNMDNPAYRNLLGLKEGMSGVVVDRVEPQGAAEGKVFADDVILSIEGEPVSNDGTIRYHGHLVGFAQMAEEKLIGETVTLKVWRKGKELEVAFPLTPYPPAEPMRNRFDELPRYVVYGGLVFMALDREFLSTFGNYWDDADNSLLYEHFFRRTEDPRPKGDEPVLLTRILPHRVNNSYRQYGNSLVATINGKAIHKLADVAEALDQAKGAFQVIELDDHAGVLILDKAKTKAAHPEILEAYGIRADRRL